MMLSYISMYENNFLALDWDPEKSVGKVQCKNFCGIMEFQSVFSVKKNRTVIQPIIAGIGKETFATFATKKTFLNVEIQQF